MESKEFFRVDCVKGEDGLELEAKISGWRIAGRFPRSGWRSVFIPLDGLFVGISDTKQGDLVEGFSDDL